MILAASVDRIIGMRRGGEGSLPHERGRSEGEREALFHSSLTTSSPPSYIPLPHTQISPASSIPPPPKPTQKAETQKRGKGEKRTCEAEAT